MSFGSYHELWGSGLITCLIVFSLKYATIQYTYRHIQTDRHYTPCPTFDDDFLGTGGAVGRLIDPVRCLGIGFSSDAEL